MLSADPMAIPMVDKANKREIRDDVVLDIFLLEGSDCGSIVLVITPGGCDLVFSDPMTAAMVVAAEK